MSSLQQFTAKAEEVIESLATPIKPYVPAIGRFLLVSTYLEDTIRLMMQWHQQLEYLQDFRHVPRYISHGFLLFNIVAMTGCSLMAIARKHTEIAVGGLFAVVVSQMVVYGLVFDLSFFVRNLSIVGGLLMLLAENLIQQRRSAAANVFNSLPNMANQDRSPYVQLAGRVLLILLFITNMFSGEMSFLRLVVGGVGLLACIMVVVGFKAKYSAMFLVLFLSVANVIMNNWWAIDFNPTHRDFVKYDFYQNLSVVG
ncbi:SURF4-domain-containing protein, partial [Ramicandelaber brevisporus]